jgi:hypothetical protein
MTNKLQATEEQLAYAKLLDLGMKVDCLRLSSHFAYMFLEFSHPIYRLATCRITGNCR